MAKSSKQAEVYDSSKIEKLEGELQSRIEAEKSYEEERALIRSKVDSLLARIEELAEA